MNYGGNMPDWHQYNTSQTNEVTPSTQNVNSGHLAYIPGVSPSTLNAISLNSEGLNKHQNNTSYNPRNYQSFNNVSNNSAIPNNSPLASMVQMQNCIGHYGSPSTRNPMLDNINASVDPRNATIGTVNDDIGYRSNQGPFNGPVGHLNGPNCNLNVSTGPRTGPGPVHGSRSNSGPGLGTNPNTGTGPGPMYGPNSRHGPASVSGSGSGPGNMGPRGTNVGPPQPPGKPGPSSSCIPCKGMCCNSDPNINYQQWEKFGSYQNNGSYRDNVHPSNYQIENRHFGNNCNFRKDNNLDGKEVMGPVIPNASTADHRRNFADYKYHKDHLAHRNYSTSSGMFHNYSVQGYNYSTEHQKYPYPVKEHAKANNMNVQNSGMLKHQEQNFIAQQKFNNKQFQYQNGNMMPKGISTLNVNANMASSSQNPYFNSQYPRNISTEISHECQETTDNASMMNRMQGTLIHNSPSQHQVYQQKIAMQKFSIENHLRELGRIPGYQSHPKYKECILRYREILKLQQSSGYQSPVQQIPRVATPANTSMPPINLQFDQNGMLINSSYLPDNFPKLQHASTVEQAPENVDRQNKDQDIVMANEKCQQSQQSEQLMIPQQNEHVPSSCAETFQKQSQFSIHKDYNQNQLKVQTSESHSFNILSTNSSNETMQQKTSKEFANKPDLDVRQFLANWDETDDEEGTTNLLHPDTILSETTPVVVVSYENIDLSSKTQQGTEVTRKTSFCPDETLESGKDGKTNIIRAQDCLTISYSSSDNSEIPKTTERTIREGVVKPGSIIHCISNGPDEIPTIHIVDNLEISNILGTPNDQVIQTLEKQKAIPFFRESSNGETMALEDTEQQDKDSVHILPANYTRSLSNVDKDTNIEDSNISETPAISMNNQELRVLSTSQKDNLGVSDNMELKKQHSFEESHNPDDISLPDLPECTPISTTLNTPIHSDTEESSQNMEDLSISTNPIEVMQNSPVISFTQLNSENKVKNISLGTIELEFQKENRYKNNEHASSEHMQEVGNFELSGSLKGKSNEPIKSKQLKNLGINAVRKKVCLIDGKESNTKILDTCAVLTSMEYELDIRQKVVESEKNSDRDSSDYTREKERYKSVGRSTEAIKHGVQRSESDDNIGSNVNLSPTESDNESQASKSDKETLRRRKVKTSTVSTNTSCLIPSELDLNIRKRAKEATTWDDRCIDRDLSQKRDADHLKQSKVSDARKFDDSSSSQGGEHSACHMTSQYKHHSAAVTKDTVLSDRKTHGVADRITNEKSAEFPGKMNNNTNTKDLPEEVEIRKRASRTHESIQSQTSRLLQKDLKGVDGDVRYTAEEMRLLKEYRKKKDKLYQACNAHDDNKNEKTTSKSHKICLEQDSISSLVSLNSENLATQDEATSHSCPKSMTKNSTDFGIQVANVNFKIKDNDIGKELILGEKSSHEHAKDPLEGIKIEINVSCTDRNVKGQEQNKRLLYDDRSLYEIDDSLSRSSTLTDCQSRKLHAKEQASSRSLSERAHKKVFEKPDAMADVVETSQGKREAEKNLRITIKQPKKDRRTSPEARNEEMDTIVPKEACSLITESQPFGKSSRGSIFFKDISKATEVANDTDRAIDHHLDAIKSKSATSNTALADAANDKAKGKNKPEDNKEGSRAREDDDRLVRMQKQTSSTSFINISGVMEKEVARELPRSKASVKLPESNIVELRNKSSNNLSNLDVKFGRYYPELDLDHDHRRVVEELDGEKYYTGKWKKPKIDDDILEDCDVFQSSSGYVNPIFSSIDKLENLHTVPVYTTKDGKISYSPNRRFTYHELMMEARRRESYPSVKKDTWNSYYSSKFRKMNKRKRHHDVSDKKKYEYKNTKCLYDRRKNYSDEFYGKNHVKCKDYIHSIRNDNAIWSDHCKIDKMYSSSDSDDQIIDRSKNHITEMNSSKKDQIMEKKGVTISKLQKDDIFINELDVESKSKENVADDPLNKDKDTDLGGTQMIQFQILDMEENNENCKNVNNNCADNSSGQSDVPSTSVQLIQEKQTVEYSVNESPMLNDSAITSENVQTVEDKNPSNQTIDKIESDEKNVVAKIELLNEASLLDEQVSLRDPERGKDDEKIISEVDIKEQEAEQKEQKKEININVSDSRAFLESENSFENIEDTESNNKSETNQVDMVGVLEFENDITKKALNPQTDFNDMFDQVSQESLHLERPKDTFNEIVEESEENIGEENVLECEEEIVQFSEEVEIPNEEVVNKVEKEDNEYLENSNNDNLSRDTSAMNQEEFESQTILTENIIDQEDNSKHISVEPIQHQDNIDTNSDQINTITEEKSLTDFSKTEIYFEHENITNNITDIVSNKGEIEVILSNIEEISVKEIITDRLKNEGEPNDLPAILEHETKSDQDSFEDKEMHILDTCCSIKNPLIADVESSKDKTEVDEQKEEQTPLEQVPCKSLARFSDSNIDMKAIPKLVIKKTDTPNSKSACSLDYTETSENCDKYDAKLSSELHPKIPKVIITKNRSRSATPVENVQKTKSDKTESFLPEQNDESMDVDNSSFESYTLKYNNCENKVPKVRIKLEDISSKDLKMYLKRKDTKRRIPKMRIKKLKTQESKRIETKDSSGTEGSTDSDEEKNFHELMSSDTEIERTPKSKLKKQEDRSWSPEKNKGKNSNISKKTKRTKEEDSKHTAKYDTAISDELKKKFPQCIIEKIPKVIIKRTQIGAEFKCEISKSKKTSSIETSKWQPKVKLQRLDVLDHMVKDLKQSRITLSDKFDLSTRMKNINNEDIIDNSKVRLSRSNSVSNLSPAKYKQRRFSDSSYMKVNTKSNIEFKNNNLDGTDNAAIFKSDESKNIRKKEKRKIFPESKQLNHSQNNESESEMGEILTKHSFQNILTNEDNDMMVVKKQYSSFDTKESTPLIEDKFLDAAIRSHNYNDNNSSIIKVDSSDESQTTIEILPASPNSSDDEAKNFEFESFNRMDMTDAMPTQLELELELIDNNNTCSEVFMPEIDYASHSKSKYSNEEPTKTFFNEFQRSSQNTFDQNKYTFLMKKQQFERNTNDNFYCNDLLIKEVLAAKETLKKCLTRSETEDVERSMPQPKTVAERKQGLSFSFKDLGKSSDKSEETCFSGQNNKMKIGDFPCDMETEEVEQDCFKQHEIYSIDCPTVSTHRNSNAPDPTTISLKSSKTSTNNSDLSNKRNSNVEKLQETKSVKKINSSSDSQKNNDNSNNTKVKENNMPLLVPEFVLNFDSGSDRDSSRSPPVITNQEGVEHVVEDAKLVESKVISQMEKIEENKKHSYKNCEMTIADIITQLAYHEKATIKHKKYCNLCERWFPTTSRHRRHLAGYQHRYMELTQRKSIHALFILFTGKPCPRLLPANVIRNDCSIGELTPLQIAVQDVAKCVEYIQQSHKTKE